MSIALFDILDSSRDIPFVAAVLRARFFLALSLSDLGVSMSLLSAFVRWAYIASIPFPATTKVSINM